MNKFILADSLNIDSTTLSFRFWSKCIIAYLFLHVFTSFICVPWKNKSSMNIENISDFYSNKSLRLEKNWGSVKDFNEWIE